MHPCARVAIPTTKTTRRSRNASPTASRFWPSCGERAMGPPRAEKCENRKSTKPSMTGAPIVSRDAVEGLWALPWCATAGRADQHGNHIARCAARGSVAPGRGAASQREGCTQGRAACMKPTASATTGWNEEIGLALPPPLNLPVFYRSCLR